MFVFKSRLKDSGGTPIWYPDNNDKPYYDRTLGTTFINEKQKQSYMKEKKIVMSGDDFVKKRDNIPEAGDTRKNPTKYYFKP